MKINKKASVAFILIGLMIALIAFVLITGTLTRWMSKSQDKEAEVLCQNSVLLNSKVKFSYDLGPLKQEVSSPLLCKTTDKKISGNKEEIEEQLAYLMARCWWMFGEGRVEDNLDSASWSKVLGWEDFDNKCFLCYTVAIDEKEIDGGSITAPEMFNYLIENDHSKIKGVKYMDYIQSYGGPGKVAVLDSVYPENIYGITYMAKSDDNAEFGLVDVGAYFVGVLGGLAIAACIIAEPCGVIGIATAAAGAVAGGVSHGYLLSHSVDVLAAKAKFYQEERAVSIVTLDDLKGIEAGECVEDLAGD